MLRAIAPHIEEHFHTGDSVAGEIAVDPRGFLAGRRYTCLRSVCGRFGPSVVTARLLCCSRLEHQSCSWPAREEPSRARTAYE